MKPFKTIEEQIIILEERGLTIADSDIENTKLYLLDNNYYNVINMYSKVFQSSPNTYIPGVQFKEIKQLHILDSEMKSLLLKNIIIAEKHFKSIFSYYFSEKYPTDTFPYLNTNNYTSVNSPLDIIQTLSKITSTINGKTKPSRTNRANNSIKHYINCYGSVPFWVLINELDFGAIKYLYKYSDMSIKNKVAKRLSDFLLDNINIRVTLEPKNIDVMLNNIVKIRNCTAHNNKLLNYKCQDNIHFIPEIYSQYQTNNSPRNDVFSVFLALQCFLSKGDYSILHNTIKKRLNHSKNKIKSIDIKKILELYGFPEDWHLTTVTRQQD